MAVMRSVLLAGSQNTWLRERATRFWFVRRTVSRFMPGEAVEEALQAALKLRERGLGTVFTYLGENVKDRGEAAQVTDHYLNVLDRIRASNLQTEISVKLTHLGLDLNPDFCYQNLIRLVERSRDGSVVWIDMEASNYVDATLDLYRRARQAYASVGVCLQAYLYRTEKDLASLIPLGASVRLVKGAYQEPPDVAFPRKKDVDENYFALVQRLLSDEARQVGVRAALGTHDRALIRRISAYADSKRLAKDAFEFQMLYGIQSAEQVRLAQEGRRSIVLISYGSYWFPWFMRRLAERPANTLFVVRNMLSL
jgi:proline dehydrogenase